MYMCWIVPTHKFATKETKLELVVYVEQNKDDAKTINTLRKLYAT